MLFTYVEGQRVMTPRPTTTIPTPPSPTTMIPSASQGPCEQGWILIGEDCTIEMDNAIWFEAQSVCAEISATLMTLSSYSSLVAVNAAYAAPAYWIAVPNCSTKDSEQCTALKGMAVHMEP